MAPAVAAEEVLVMDTAMDTAMDIAVGLAVTANVALAQEAHGGPGVLKVNRANRVNKARGVLADWKARAAHADFWAHRARRAIPVR